MCKQFASSKNLKALLEVRLAAELCTYKPSRSITVNKEKPAESSVRTHAAASPPDGEGADVTLDEKLRGARRDSSVW